MTEKQKHYLKLAGKIFLVIAIIIFSFARAKKEPIQGDFHVFWQAGVDLWSRIPIYETRPGLQTNNNDSELFEVCDKFIEL